MILGMSRRWWFDEVNGVYLIDLRAFIFGFLGSRTTGCVLLTVVPILSPALYDIICWSHSYTPKIQYCVSLLKLRCSGDSRALWPDVRESDGPQCHTRIGAGHSTATAWHVASVTTHVRTAPFEARFVRFWTASTLLSTAIISLCTLHPFLGYGLRRPRLSPNKHTTSRGFPARMSNLSRRPQERGRDTMR